MFAVEPAALDGTAGWIGVGGRNAFGPPARVDSDFGFDVIGGAWLLREHLQPIAKVGWSRAAGGGTIDALRFGVGLAAGGAVARERLWLGGILGVAVFRTWARGGEAADRAWGSTINLSALVLGRFARRLLLGVEFGPEFSAPTIHFMGPKGATQWGVVRFNAGLRLGVILGPAIPRRTG